MPGMTENQLRTYERIRADHFRSAPYPCSGRATDFDVIGRTLVVTLRYERGTESKTVRVNPDGSIES